MGGWVEGKIMTESDKRSEREQETFRLNFISESIFYFSFSRLQRVLVEVRPNT